MVEEDRVLQTRVREIRGIVPKERDNRQMRKHTCKIKIWQDKCRKCRKVGKSIKEKRTHGKTWYGKINQGERN